ncbi:MAG: radical SAM protein, partial [Treponema sp.]|nr:radical SAM protein [Treponema sp.]
MSGIHNIVFIQPPFVQLNSPYPAPYYLKAFLEKYPSEKKEFHVTVRDHSIGLFEKIFCHTGLAQVFHDAEETLPCKNTAHITERFLSEKKLWLMVIDRLVAFLRGRDPEWGHLLALANGAIPGGPRTDAFIAARGGEISPDDTKLLATMLLSDIADFITCVLDSGFSLIRYAPFVKNSALGYRDFAAVKKSLNGYIMNAFYRPMLNEEWEKLEMAKGADGKDSPFLLGLSIPFPGCLCAALVCAESAKQRF